MIYNSIYKLKRNQANGISLFIWPPTQWKYNTQVSVFFFPHLFKFNKSAMNTYRTSDLNHLDNKRKQDKSHTSLSTNGCNHNRARRGLYLPHGPGRYPLTGYFYYMLAHCSYCYILPSLNYMHWFWGFLCGVSMKVAFIYQHGYLWNSAICLSGPLTWGHSYVCNYQRNHSSWSCEALHKI